jgi:hypothetical protein
MEEAKDYKSVSAQLDWRDRLGGWKVRWGIGRQGYKVEPGLYAIGKPGTDSVVLVTANYKLTFDMLRRELGGLDAWIVVMDTKGINVWCAAGKGSFGTDELVRQIEQVVLAGRVSHCRVIVPQLGAPGVSAHEVRKRTGFTVVYGPVRASDIKAFLDADMKATEEMRRVHFGFYDRLILTPVEVVMSLKYLLVAAAAMLLISSFKGWTFSTDSMLQNGGASAAVLLVAYLAGTVLGPALLPWLPGRSFSLKGGAMGLAAGAAAWAIGLTGNSLQLVAWVLVAMAVSSFLLMNFTGSSTYTSLSGVRKEMRIAVPMQAAAAVIGIGLWLAGTLRG